MVALETALRLVGGLILLLSNGFFVTIEFALTRVRQFTESEFRNAGLDRAWEMTERLEIYLSGCQVGITISSVGLGVVAEPALASVIDAFAGSLGLTSVGQAGHTAGAVILALAIINLLHVIVGEQAPTYLGIERTKLVTRYGAPLLYWWTMLMYPVIIVSDRIAKGLLGLFGVEISRSWTHGESADVSSRAELREEMATALQGFGLPADRREEVMNALDIGDIPVEDVMVERDSIIALSTTDSLDDNVERMASSPHVRFPLVGESVEEFYGIIYTPIVMRHLDALADGTLDLESVATEPMTVETGTPVSDLIDRFQSEHQELALVEEDGHVVGLVTTTDAMEQITGQLADPMDDEQVESG